MVARVCLNRLRSRRSRREDPWTTGAGRVTPDRRSPGRGRGRGRSVEVPEARSAPEGQALLADSLGVALLVVLDTLTPADVSPSCCTTCSASRSRRSPRCWTGPRRPRGSSPAGPGAGCRARRRPEVGGREPRPPAARPRVVEPSLPRPGRGTSGRCWSCWTPGSCCGPTPPRSDGRRGGGRRRGRREGLLGPRAGGGTALLDGSRAWSGDTPGRCGWPSSSGWTAPAGSRRSRWWPTRRPWPRDLPRSTSSDRDDDKAPGSGTALLRRLPGHSWAGVASTKSSNPSRASRRAAREILISAVSGTATTLKLTMSRRFQA